MLAHCHVRELHTSWGRLQPILKPPLRGPLQCAYTLFPKLNNANRITAIQAYRQKTDVYSLELYTKTLNTPKLNFAENRSPKGILAY